MTVFALWCSFPCRSSHTALSKESKYLPIASAALCGTWMEAVHSCRRCTYTELASMSASERKYDDPASSQSIYCNSQTLLQSCSVSSAVACNSTIADTHFTITSDVFCDCIPQLASSRHSSSEQFRGRRHLHLNQQTQHASKTIMAMPQESPGTS